ncbi:hypothetical protein MN608_00614 [Microdochium nivale]|nr:hypothetical protein MN608_00614 [Microdochium nivale]
MDESRVGRCWCRGSGLRLRFRLRGTARGGTVDSRQATVGPGLRPKVVPRAPLLLPRIPRLRQARIARLPARDYFKHFLQSQPSLDGHLHLVPPAVQLHLHLQLQSQLLSQLA